MRWLCWFVPHKWIESIAPEYQQCERCPKTRIKPIKPAVLPRGAVHCPYLECSGWVTPPAKDTYAHSMTTKCRSCKQPLRWERQYLHCAWEAPTVVGD